MATYAIFRHRRSLRAIFSRWLARWRVGPSGSPRGTAVLSTVTDPGGHSVVLTAGAWAHVLAGHPELAHAQAEIMAAVQYPDHQEPDVRTGRERYWLQGAGPSRWLRVVVDFGYAPAEVVTAFADRKGPAGWTP